MTHEASPLKTLGGCQLGENTGKWLHDLCVHIVCLLDVIELMRGHISTQVLIVSVMAFLCHTLTVAQHGKTFALQGHFIFGDIRYLFSITF